MSGKDYYIIGRLSILILLSPYSHSVNNIPLVVNYITWDSWQVLITDSYLTILTLLLTLLFYTLPVEVNSSLHAHNTNTLIKHNLTALSYSFSY